MEFKDFEANLNEKQVTAISEDGKMKAYFFMKGKKVVDVELELLVNELIN